ncbi:hypothetical protein B0H10DRAFT_1943279 [Mycena sp. CBHHK59/15]|nr:hypothetical protein B0H10DRAFT_1943279 [Mycena sp. CBHHK59/15]
MVVDAARGQALWMPAIDVHRSPRVLCSFKFETQSGPPRINTGTRSTILSFLDSEEYQPCILGRHGARVLPTLGAHAPPSCAPPTASMHPHLHAHRDCAICGTYWPIADDYSHSSPLGALPRHHCASMTSPADAVQQGLPVGQEEEASRAGQQEEASQEEEVSWSSPSTRQFYRGPAAHLSAGRDIDTVARY